jgi:uncharacterized membrane protein
VSKAAWRKHISILFNWLYLYPVPDPLPRRRSFWVATGLVALAALLFAGFFIFYLTVEHDAYLTHAEDLGIMDQAIWTTIHGQVLHQTICNTLTDTNCYSSQGISRFALHFEPMLFLISLLYLVVPNPKTLLVLQTVVVAAGAFPAFWLARLRLRSEWAAAGMALLYLLYPTQQNAERYDFHAVTLTASLLLFMLYFMYTRRTVWLFVCAILSMACKEEIPGVVALFGVWSMLFQRRWRSGLALVVLGLAWTGLAFLIFHVYSPTGASLLSPRFANLGNGPVQILRTLLLHPVTILHEHVLEHDHFFYLRGIFSAAGYVPVLAPWVLVLLLPTVALNLLSSNPQMYSGLYQYNAEMTAPLIFATIEAIVLILWLLKGLAARLAPQKAQLPATRGDSDTPLRPRSRSSLHIVHGVLLAVLISFVVLNGVRQDYLRGNLPFSVGFEWPQLTPHTRLAQQFIEMIPPTASVSAQSSLVPHVSQRSSIYLFPYNDEQVDYVFLDVTSDIYPYINTSDYIREVRRIMLSGKYGIAASQDGYLLLKRGIPPPSISPFSLAQPGKDTDLQYVLPNLPERFCSYINASPDHIPHPLQVRFTGPGNAPTTLDLVGFHIDPEGNVSVGSDVMTVTTYWRLIRPITTSLQLLVIMTTRQGREYLASSDIPALWWCQTNMWTPGRLIRQTSRAFSLRSSQIPVGRAHVSIALVPLLPSSPLMEASARLRLQVIHAPAPVTPVQETNLLQLTPITVVP